MRRPLLVALTVAVLDAAAARAEIVVLQNDDFVGGSYTCNLGVDVDESLAAKFTAPPSAYPYTLRKIHVLACGGEQAQYAVDIWRDDGDTPNPGTVLWSSGSTAWMLDGTNTFNVIDLGNEVIVTSGTVRVGLYNFFTPGGNVGFAVDGSITSHRNFVRSALGAWSFAEIAGLTGDFILRLEISTDVIFEDGFEET